MRKYVGYQAGGTSMATGGNKWDAVFEKEKVWRAIFDLIPEPVSIHDSNFKIIKANKALADRVGSTPEGLEGQYCYDVFHADGQPPDKCPHADTVSSGKSACGQLEIPKMNGVYTVTTAPLLVRHGDIVSYVHIITDAKDVDSQPLSHVAKMNALGQLVAGVAHELNNPLTGIIGFSELILTRRHLDEQVRRDLEKINGEAIRARKIVMDLSLFARKRQAQMSIVGVNGILAQVLEAKVRETEKMRIRVKKRLTSDLPKISGDFYQLQQVFSNVIENSIQAMSDQSMERVLKVESKLEASKIIVSVSDTGPGISKNNLTRIFEPFYTTKEAGKGMGLGLAIVYGLVQEHGGSIKVDSVQGKGATFTIEFPICRVTSAGDVEETGEPEELNASSAMNILVVDDDEVVVDLFFNYLKRGGHRVDTARWGDVAVRKLNREDYDLVFLDIVLPRVNGREIFKRLKQTKPSMSKNVVFVTGDLASKETKEFLEKAGRPFITKPFGLNDIKKAVKEVERCA